MRKKLYLSELHRLNLEEYKSSKKIPLVVVADNIRSAMNVGSLFRTSDAMGIERLVMTGISAKPPHKEINKTAIGATHSVEWQYYEDTEYSLNKLKKEGYTILAVEQTSDSTLLSEWKEIPYTKVAIVLGNEVHGVSDEAINMADHCIEIGQYGTKHSLNVSVCAGIVLWHFSRLLREK